MKRLIQTLLAACMLVMSLQARSADPAAGGVLCPNKFPDFINDVCWSCMFPFKIFGSPVATSQGGEDFTTKADSSPVCFCENALKAGVPVSFWEMAYMIDVHTAPGCLPTLGGLKLDLEWAEENYGAIGDRDPRRKWAFRNAAYYVSPMMYLLEVVLDDACSDRSPFDVGWTSEFDPSWNDDELAMIKMPVAFAFGNLAGAMAAGIDSAAAMIGFPKNEIFWQAGSWGPIYPLTGTVAVHKSPDNTGHLLATRMLAEAHAMDEMAELFGKGSGRSYACEPGEVGCTTQITKQVMCAGSPIQFPEQLIMLKKQYKIQRLFPTPYTWKTLLGGCCTPIGRSTALREQMTSVPLSGYKDFGYSIFRKRDCCSGVVSPATMQ